jgi:hypothetical protein
MACQDCVRKNCENCTGPTSCSSFNYSDKQRARRRQTIIEKRVGKYTRNQMFGCAICGALTMDSVCYMCRDD